jgi:hypothetical protein
MSQLQKQLSEKARLRGRRFFIWQEGVLRFGLPAFLFLAINRIMLGIFIGNQIPPVWEVVLEAGLVGAIFGRCMGSYLWRKGDVKDKDDHVV